MSILNDAAIDLAIIGRKAVELYRQHVYTDGDGLRAHGGAKGKLTIGYGLNVEAEGLSEVEASWLLERKLIKHGNAFGALWPHLFKLDSVRQSVMLELAYNMGPEGLFGFHDTLKALERGDWDEAKRHLLASKWADDVDPRQRPGVGVDDELAERLRSGQIQPDVR